MSIFEYNQEAHMKCVRQEGYEDGLAEGISQGISQGFSQGIAQGISQGRTDALLVSIQNLMKNMNLTATQAMDALNIPVEERAQYWEQL